MQMKTGFGGMRAAVAATIGLLCLCSFAAVGRTQDAVPSDSWGPEGQGCSGDRDRDCRFALAYDKPV
jgi:hypothetical protein